MACHCCVVVGFNVLKVTLKPSKNTMFSLTNILCPTCYAGNQINQIFTLAVDIGFAREIAFVCT